MSDFMPPRLGLNLAKDVCPEDAKEDCSSNLKFEIKLKSNTDFKYKCFKVAEIFKTEGFEDIYINETQGIFYCFVYAKTLKRAKYKAWKILRSHNLNDYFGSVEVKEIGDGS